MGLKNIAEKLHALERKAAPFISAEIPFDELMKKTGLNEVEATRAVQWLSNKGFVHIKAKEKEIIAPDKNGEFYLKNGMPERRFLEAIKDLPYNLKEIGEIASLDSDELNLCVGLLKKNAAIEFTGGVASINENGMRMLLKESLEESLLRRVSEEEVDKGSLKDEEMLAFQNLMKRKGVIRLKRAKEIIIKPTEQGKKLAKIRIGGEKIVDTLTSSMIKDRSYRNAKFRRYDVEINVPAISGGRRHFVNQAIKYIRKIWLELGFAEMEGTLIQTSFWDLDALFVPQDHPAREMQDTFYIKDPKYGRLPGKLYRKIKEVHENGADTGSRGWRGKWSEAIAKENLLRTHTTVLSAQTISRLKKADLPAKFFSVKRVYRNEALSWKSLFEFIQVEGIVVDPEANFKHLKGYLKNFFAKMGFPDVRIRPGHFPYTEPSAEVDVFHPGKKAWVEFGGSGIFRPEVTKPLMGIEVPVLAWGLGMERSIMKYYGMEDIRELYRNDLKQLREIKSWMK